MKKSAMLAFAALLVSLMSQPTFACGSDAECKGHNCDKKAAAGAKVEVKETQKEAAAAPEKKTETKSESDSK